MTTEPTRDIDQILTGAGEHWRATQPQPPEPDLDRLTGSRKLAPAGSRRWSRALVPAGAAVGLLVVLSAVITPVVLRRQHTTPAGPDRFPSRLSVDHGAGVRVSGTGILFRGGDGLIRLCDMVVVTADAAPPAHAQCGALEVPTTGVDSRWLTLTTEGGQSASDQVRVDGVYHDGTLAVSGVVAVALEPRQPDLAPPVPCQAPAGGWRPGTFKGQDLPPEEIEQALARLYQAVEAGSDHYSAVWVGHPVDGAARFEVRVVGTTGDVARARADLAAIFPGNLCVHPVRYSAADLKRIEVALSGASATPMTTEPLAAQDKLRVRVVAFDPPTVAVLEKIDPGALLLEEPLLQPGR